MLRSTIGFLLIAIVCYSASVKSDIVNKLMDRYHNRAIECFDSNGNVHPGFACYGLFMRGTQQIGTPNGLPFAWSFKDGAESFSFMLLRVDLKVSVEFFTYRSGMVVFPPLETPKDKKPIEPECGFPINASTDRRKEHKRCIKYEPWYMNENRDVPHLSGWCHLQGIDTLRDWEQDMYNVMAEGMEEYFGTNQCAFDLTNPSTAIKHFGLIVGANALIQSKHRNGWKHNEFVVNLWDVKDIAAILSLPIEAIFYIINPRKRSEIGLKEALMYQEQYSNITNQIVPVAGIDYRRILMM